MSENTEATVGQILREAREARGMSVDDASMRLRLMHRQIEAMEADSFETLGQPVFARGFVRNYARLLGLAPDDLLARMPGAAVEPPAVSQAAPVPARSWLSSPWLILLLLGVLVVAAVPVALYLWLNSEPDEEPVRVPVAAQSQPVPAAAPTPAAAGAEAAGEAEATTEAADAAEAADADTGGRLHLEFGAEAWVEIRDASRRTLHRQLNPAGSSIDVQGQPPFELVIGNAAQARMLYNGRPIDLKPFIDGTVARFSLEE